MSLFVFGLKIYLAVKDFFASNGKLLWQEVSKKGFHLIFYEYIFYVNVSHPYRITSASFIEFAESHANK